MATKSTERRVLVKDLEQRVSELEQKIQQLTEQINKLDQRIQKIADLVAVQASRL